MTSSHAVHTPALEKDLSENGSNQVLFAAIWMSFVLGLGM